MTIIIHGWVMTPIDGIAALLRGGFSFLRVRGWLCACVAGSEIRPRLAYPADITAIAMTASQPTMTSAATAPAAIPAFSLSV